MKVLALIEFPDHVCYRYRIKAFASALAERGLAPEAEGLERSLARRASQLVAVRDADVVVLQRKLLPLWQLGLLRRTARRLVFDFDDAVYQRDSYHRHGPESWKRRLRFATTLRVCDAVIAGNRHLADRASSVVASERVQVVPTCVEPERYPVARHRRLGSDVRLAWIGSSSTLQGWQAGKPCLAAVAERLAGIELRLICDRDMNLPGLKVVLRPWSKTTEAAELASCDVGVSWLPDDSWSRGKCGLKTLQYMAAGLPVVANPVGMNCRMIQDGKTGFLASTPQEWADAIAALAADPDLRSTMGAAGRRFVEGHYSVARWGAQFASILENAACGNAVPACHAPHQEAISPLSHDGDETPAEAA